MKKLVLVVVVLGVFGAAAALVLGNLRARAAHQGLTQGVQEGSGIRVVEESFQPGLGSATSLVRFEVDAKDGAFGASADGGAPTVGFRMESRIEHGALPTFTWMGTAGGGSPVIARMHTELTLDGEAANQVRELVGTLPPFEIDTVVRISGVGESTFRMRPHKGEGNASMGSFSFDWKGLEGRMVFTGDMQQFAGNFRSGGLQIDAGMIGFGLAGLEGVIDFSADPSGLPVGTWTAKLESASFEPSLLPIPAVTLSSWEMKQQSRVQGGRYDLEIAHSIEQIAVGEDVYGPGKLDFGLLQLDAATFGQVRTEVETFRAGGQDEAAKAALGARMMELMPQLVAHSPKVRATEISLETPEGVVRGDFEFALDGAQAEMLAANPLMAMAALTATASAEMPAPIFATLVGTWASKQVAARAASGELSVGEDPEETLAYARDSLIHNMRKAGYVVFDGNRYKTRIAFREGNLTINGLPVNPMELGGVTAALGGDGGAGGGIEFPETGDASPGFGGSPPASLGY